MTDEYWRRFDDCLFQGEPKKFDAPIVKEIEQIESDLKTIRSRLFDLYERIEPRNAIELSKDQFRYFQIYIRVREALRKAELLSSSVTCTRQALCRDVSEKVVDMMNDAYQENKHRCDRNPL